MLPPSRGWLGGGIEKPLEPAGVVPALPALGTTLEPEDLFIVVLVSVSEGGSMSSTVPTSRCNGDECTGELDFLLAASPLPPREEFRGETLPVYRI